MLALPVALWSLLQRVLAGYGYRLGRAVAVLVLLLAATTATVLATNATSRGWVLTGIAAVAVLLLTTVAAGVGHRLTDFTGATAPPALTPSRTELEPSPAADRPQRAVSVEDLAVEAYLDTDDPLRARAVFSALDDVVELLGYERPEQETIQRGSWWRRTRARARDWLTSEEMRVRRIKVERALELVTIDVRQAEVDVKTAEAVARLMASLQDIPQACLRAGSVLVVKYDGDNGPVVLSRTLSQVEIKALELFPEIQAKPRQVLEALATAITALEDGDEPAP